MKLGQVTTTGFVTLMGAIVGLGIAYNFTNNILLKSIESVVHTYKVKNEVMVLEKHLLDAETGQRGFIFTGKINFLEPYNKALTEIERDFNQIENLIKDNPQQIERIKQIKDLVEMKLDELAQTITLKKANKESELRAIVLSEKGKHFMDDIRLKLQETIDVEEELLTKRQESARQAEQVTTIVGIGGTATALLLGISSLIFISRRVVRPINEVTAALASSSSEIAAVVEQQERISSQQAASVGQITSTMEELNASAKQSAEQAASAAAGAHQAFAQAQTGTKTVEQTLEGMAALKDKVTVIAERIIRLSEQTSQIGKISSLVSELTNQTNMLALNAAVEAVRAGEHGKGFGVVAGEIRKLADRSQKATQDIHRLVDDIQNAINLTVMATEEGTKTVDVSVQTAQETAQKFQGVVSSIEGIGLNTQQISLTAKQQAIAIQQVVEAMNCINHGAVETASGISQTRVGTQKLNEAALNLKIIV